MLDYKTIMGDLLVFKNNNDCMTISRSTLGRPTIKLIEVDGEKIDSNEHPFTPQEIIYFLDNYEQIVGPKY